MERTGIHRFIDEYGLQIEKKVNSTTDSEKRNKDRY